MALALPAVLENEVNRQQSGFEQNRWASNAISRATVLVKLMRPDAFAFTFTAGLRWRVALRTGELLEVAMLPMRRSS